MPRKPTAKAKLRQKSTPKAKTRRKLTPKAKPLRKPAPKAKPRRKSTAAPRRQPSRRTKATRPSKAPPSKGLAPLAWKTASAQHRTARGPSGTYLMITHDGCITWSAEWRAEGSRPQSLAFRVPLAKAEQACENHRMLLDANERLIASGHGELTGKDVTGEAVAWKRGRR